MKFNFRKYLSVLNPNPSIGGLEISDGALRFVMLHADGSVAAQAIEPLSAGVIGDGRVLRAEDFASALAKLRSAVGGFRRMVPVIVSLPPQAVYSQVFSIPAARADQLEEAARLNLRMLSPIDFASAYADWQNVDGGVRGSDGSIDALGAFVEASVSDGYYTALFKSRFLPVAIEFASLSLARALAASADMGDTHDPYLVVNCTASGITLLAMRNGSPYFTEFTESRLIARETNGEEGAVTLTQFQAAAHVAIARFLNFYRTRWGGTIGKALVVNVTSNKALEAWIKKEFPLEVYSLGGYATLDKSWCVASGAALRGLIPRAHDTFISLARVGTEDEFERNRVRRFIALWRAVALSVLGVTVFISIALDMAMVHRKNILMAKLAGGGTTSDTAEVAALAMQAARFNKLAEKALAAQVGIRPIANILRDIYTALGQSVVLTRIEVDAQAGTIRLSGTAASEQDVIAFKARLANNLRITEIALPLAAITALPNGHAAFTATVTLRQ